MTVRIQFFSSHQHNPCVRLSAGTFDATGGDKQ